MAQMGKIGIAISGGLNPAEIIDLVVLAESLGYESAWIAEGHGGDQFAILAACAMRTSRIRLGTSISSVFVRTAPTIAMAASSVADLSGGRFILGLGSSHKVQVEPEHGVAYGKPLKRTRETVAIVRALIRDGRVRFDGETVRIETDAGVKICELRSREGNRFEFRTTMGEPKVYGELAVGLNYDEVKGIPVSMGNPHYVIFVDEFPPQWQDMAAEVATHRDFPNGTNVELARVVNEHKLEVRIWERGVGETLSSGTGSSASAVAAIASGRAQSPVSVHTPGGTQTVEWNSEVFLTGPATLLCRGEFFS